MNQSIDIPFSVPFVHRLRVTDDVAGADIGELIGVLEPTAALAKVLIVAEMSLQSAASRLADRLKSAATVDLVSPPVLLEGGEQVKNSTAAVKQVLGRINDANLDRRSYIIAVGGGAMLDAVGYAAAIAHRGIRMVRLPSTTLSQADSGVGVKNAINYFGKKNWIGTFAPPWAVINDTALLQSLPDRDFVSGFSEAVKVALIKDSGEFRWLCAHAERIRHRETAVVKRAINQCCRLHLQHITAGGDPFETLQARPLDFGHWSAHRLESLTGYTLRHGEAVGIGVVIDCIYAALKHGFPESEVEAVTECLASLGIPLWHDSLLPVDRLLSGLEEFRQHLGGALTVTMLRGVGDPINVHQIDTAAMTVAVERLRSVQSSRSGG